jgi:rubrerythrin
MEEDLQKKLTGLAQLDTDAVTVYDEAMKHVTDDEVKTNLQGFRAEHDFHAKQLSETINRMWGVTPELKVDVMGHMADWFTSMRSMGGTEGALHALKTAEGYHNTKYREATMWDTDEELRNMLDRFYQNEKHHLEYVEAHLKAGASQR